MDLKIINSLVFPIFILFNLNCVFSFVEQTIFEIDNFFSKPKNSSLIPLPENVVLPGTKWCGPGDIANSESDLGIWKETDKCCREHDNCYDIIEGHQSKHGLKNSDPFTRLHCDCEQKFQNCLRKANRLTAIAVAQTYTTFRTSCYREDYPILWCSKYQGGFLKLRCLSYMLDDTKPKKWQWFDIPLFHVL